MGRILIIFGVILIIIGVAIHYHDHFRWLGRLPGDIRIERENFSFYFPITTSILISVLLSLIWYLYHRYRS